MTSKTSMTPTMHLLKSTGIATAVLVIATMGVPAAALAATHAAKIVYAIGAVSATDSAGTRRPRIGQPLAVWARELSPLSESGSCPGRLLAVRRRKVGESLEVARNDLIATTVKGVDQPVHAHSVNSSRSPSSPWGVSWSTASIGSKLTEPPLVPPQFSESPEFKL